MASRRQHGEGSLYQRGKRGGRGGQWVAVADLGWKPGPAGKLIRDRREFTGLTPDAAIEKRAQFLHRHRDGFTLPKGRQPTVSEWVKHWLWNIAKPGVDPNTFYRSYRQKCEDYVIPFFGKIKLAELDEDDISAWHAWLSQRPSRRGGTLSPGTVVTAHRILSAALNVAAARRRLPHNPCSFVPPPKYDRPEPEPPTAEEVERILDACRGRPNGARWVLAICTGLRQGEALGLRWRDVRLADPASVTVRQALARIDGADVLKPPKSQASKRTVPLPARAAAALRAHREGVTDISGRVFPAASREDWQEWADLLAGLGLPHYRVHDIRHQYATALLEEGEDQRVVQDLMGHSDARMLQIYQHVRPAMHEHARSALDRRFGG